MKPVKMDDCSRGRLTKETLLFLNITAAGLQYSTRILSRNNTNVSVRSKGGISLPNELWAMILNYVREGKKGTEDRFCFVKADPSVASPDRMLLRCTRHKFNHPADEFLASDLNDSQSVRDFEDYMACATPSEAENLGIKVPKLRRLSGPDNTFYVVLNTTQTDSCLYTFRDVPDFIAVVDYGCCWICDGNRFVCPGCTRKRLEGFGAFTDCSVELACPLCMGLDISAKHQDFLEECDNYEESKDEANGMQRFLEERLTELGYSAAMADMAYMIHGYR
ncbi:hypothetical protein F4820DRAFT_458211 [Hypoxylon rubiginosum]|uniref:Uncharacterized protein n=1 Tax=Hypoxylon rubiginosum TaxID=110542 RepID=A0ACB9Z155_9PEZI|nr:hypothetical protein F4820DRAFT_458211 [Hypoxylon rubiginosum]